MPISMPLLSLGLSHEDAPIGVRERLAVTTEGLSDALVLLGREVNEGVILSTCNRTEIYAVVDHRQSGERAVDRFLLGLSDMPIDEIGPYLRERWQEDAARHLFRVAAGLESMVVGEAQILGQVRSAVETAATAGTAGPILQRLFNQALVVGKRARSETAIARNAVSLSSAAVEQARRVLGSLKGTTVLLVGAGKMSELAALTLRDKGVRRVLVANRTVTRADGLVEKLGGESVPFDRLAESLQTADIVISSTTAPGYVITAASARAALAQRGSRPIALVDIAVPRDIEPTVAELAGVHLSNVDDLRAVCETNLEQRRAETDKVDAFVEAELKRFIAWRRARDVTPTISALVNKAEHIRRREIKRALSRMNGLSERDLNAVNALSVAIVNKLLHDPIVTLKERSAGLDSRHYTHAVRELFNLPDE